MELETVTGVCSDQQRYETVGHVQELLTQLFMFCDGREGRGTAVPLATLVVKEGFPES